MFSFLRFIRSGTSHRPVRRRFYRPIIEMLEDRRVLSATLQVTGAYGIPSFAGVGFQENQVATLAASVNGEPDPNKGDFQAQIQWGDGGTSNGDLVYTGTNGGFADFLIKGTHTYTQANSDIAINVSVTGPGGSSANGQTAFASVTNMPSGIPGTSPAAATTTAPAAVVVQVTGA